MNEAYRQLRQTPLHACDERARAHFAGQVSRWLADPDAETRCDAAERLATAVMWADLPRILSTVEVYWAERLDWLTGVLDVAHAVHPDVIPNFLRTLRFRSPSGPQIPIVLAWLDRLERDPPPGLDRDLILAIRIMMEPNIETASPKRWIGLLDHASDWVRGCAARRLAGCDEETSPTEAELLVLIGEKEIVRPGIAGAFRGELVLFGPDEATRQQVALWMMDLLERRRGPAPDDIPYNDIDFHLHELCCASPEMVDRMIRGGFTPLALMTATEVDGRVEGMEAHLRVLSQDPDPGIASGAARHLATFYPAEDRATRPSD